MGTVDYMAPEQAEAAASATAAADVYSLGCTLYHLLAGRAPYADRTGTLDKLIAHREAPVPPLPGGLPAGLARVVAKMLAKRPEDRFAEPGAVAEALAPYAAGADLVGLLAATGEPAGASPRVPIVSPALVSTRATTPVPVRPWRRRLFPAAVVAAALVATVLGVTWVYWRVSGDGQSKDRDGPARLDARGAGTAPADQGPLTGELVVRVWSPDRGKRGLRIGLTTEDGAVPVQEDDMIQIEATLSRPAHAYLLWIDGKGVVTPLYPWNDGDKIRVEGVAAAPPVLARTKRVLNPNRASKGWPVDDTPGLDTILLLARPEPWPAGRDLAALLGKVPAAPLHDPGEVVVRGWDGGRALTPAPSLDLRRAPKKEAQEIDDQLVQLVDRLGGDFELIRAVRFAHVPKRR
jgi:hypothetical protein